MLSEERQSVCDQQSLSNNIMVLLLHQTMLPGALPQSVEMEVSKEVSLSLPR